MALVIDQILFWIQRQLFPHVYGGDGLLRDAVRFALNVWEDFKGLIFKPKLPDRYRACKYVFGASVYTSRQPLASMPPSGARGLT